MPLTPAISGNVTITCKDISGSTTAKIFASVIDLEFDYFKGVVKIVDSVQGMFVFGLTTLTTITVTIAGTVTSVVIS